MSKLPFDNPNAKLSKDARCKMCGAKGFTIVKEISDHMMTHPEFVMAMRKIMPGFAPDWELR